MTKAIRWSAEELAAFEKRNAAPLKPNRIAPAKTGTQRMQALGRLKDGQMNKSEARFAQHLESEKQAGRILWWSFEGMKFKLAAATFLTPDFAVLAANGHLQMFDVKGARAIYTDDARVKMKVCADKFPLAFFVAFPQKGGGWEIEEV